MAPKKCYDCLIVSYRRTSTDDQKLGIEAQDATVHRLAEQRNCKIVRAYTEHESGANNDRPELERAIKHARRVGAVLVVAKLDRLARDSAFLMKLYDGDVPVLFGDMPEIDGTTSTGRLQVQMMANFAEFERRRIGERTREALAALKAQGVKLGTPANLTDEARRKGQLNSAKARIVKAVEDMSDVTDLAAKLHNKGQSLRQIAAHLDAEGYTTRKGSHWNAIQVKRILDRVQA
jgi:DNA invertase Pin-like site-specific DNA recombinase